MTIEGMHTDFPHNLNITFICMCLYYLQSFMVENNGLHIVDCEELHMKFLYYREKLIPYIIRLIFIIFEEWSKHKHYCRSFF